MTLQPPPRRPLKSALRHIDQLTVSAAARRETRSRENHLPPVSVYRWWARRTEAINGALLDAVACEHDGSRLLVADPFAGGGVIPLAALRRGHEVYAQDLNPWVADGLKVMLGLPASAVLRRAAKDLLSKAEQIAARAYGTTFNDGAPAQIIHALRVASASCPDCGEHWKLFPHALVSLTRRKDRGGSNAYLACRRGHLFEGAADTRTTCPECGDAVDPEDTYLPQRVATCPNCGNAHSLETLAPGWRWDLCLVERSDGKRREFGLPSPHEIALGADEAWRPRRRLGAIPESVETRVLRRHNFQTWSDIYPARQRHVLERLLELCRKSSEPNAVGDALRMAILGTAEMAGLLSRWDRFYLKAFESMAAHRFNFTTLTAETNIVGVGAHGRGTLRRRLHLFDRAAQWFEVQKVQTSSDEEAKPRSVFSAVSIVEGSSEHIDLEDRCVDVILTDPPYHDDVQYHELSLPLRAWAQLTRVRPAGEAVAIPHSAALSGHRRYRDVLMRIFRELHRVTKEDGRLIFSYANREPAAWVNLFAALKASGFQPLAYTIVHSENESDHAKKGGRACNLDLILEMVPTSPLPRETWRPEAVFDSDEERFLRVVGDAFLKSGAMVNGWEAKLVDQLKSEIFVRGVGVDAARSATAKISASPRTGDAPSL